MESSKDGYTFLLARYCNGTGETVRVTGWDDFAKLALAPSNSGRTNFFYNADFDFSVLSKYLGSRALQDLAVAKKTHKDGVMVNWIPDKSFSLRGKGGSIEFFDAAQYFDYAPLHKAAKYVGQKKGSMGSDVDPDRYTKDPVYASQLDAYCLNDAKLACDLGQLIVDAIRPVAPTRRFQSCASLAQDLVLSRIGKRLRPAPKQVVLAAWMSFGGGRVESTKKGHFEHVSQVDLRSAYAAEFASLPNPCGEWTRVLSHDKTAAYGFYQVEVETKSTYLGPLHQRRGEGLYYPHGLRTTWVEKSELELLKDLNFNPQILEGFELPATDDRPFHFLNDVYEHRLKVRQEGIAGRAADAILKKILSAAYGKTIERHQVTDHVAALSEGEEQFAREIIHPSGKCTYLIPKAWAGGKLYNPVLGAAITARVRTKLIRQVNRHELDNKLISIAQDALFLTGSPPKSMFHGEQMGEWRLTQEDQEAVFVGNGIYAIRDPETGSTTTRFRGFDPSWDLFDILEKDRTSFTKMRPMKIRESIRDRVPDQIGVFRPVERILNLNTDARRAWSKEVGKASDLLHGDPIDSTPLVMEVPR